MTVQEERLYYLMKQFADNQLSEEEIAEMLDLLKQVENEDQLADWTFSLREKLQADEVSPSVDWEKMWTRIREGRPRPAMVRPINPVWRIAIAAAVLLFIVGGYWLFVQQRKTDSPVAIVQKDIKPPQSNRATITLADGRTVYLDSAANGSLAIQEGVNLLKLANGQIAYQGDHAAASDVHYNTLTNPRGSQVIDMQLSDGSHVWLDAASSVTYPVAFTGPERRITITGEAYFEVTHDANKPFYVSKGDVEVKVLGTHFNVNAYEDEDAIRVTLLEGSVQVKRQDQQTLLKPGQQAIARNNAALTTAKEVNLDEVMAWKNGRFLFDKTDIRQVMRQIARWYNVEIRYEGEVKGFFNGGIDRKTNALEVLKMLSLTGEAKFGIDGNVIVVKP